MDEITIELTNACNLHCLHCIRNKADAPQFLPLALAGKILAEARALGFRTVSLTGGEAALYPHLEEFLALVAEQGFTLKLVSNGHRFRENLLPSLSAPNIREKLEVVCLSLDGAEPQSHDALRGPGSFREVVEAAALCQLKGLHLSFKSVITNFNKDHLMDLALLATTLGARDQSFIYPYPTPRSIMGESSRRRGKSWKSWPLSAATWSKRCAWIFVWKPLTPRPCSSSAITSWIASMWIIRATCSCAATFPMLPGGRVSPVFLGMNGWGTSGKFLFGKV